MRAVRSSASAGGGGRWLAARQWSARRLCAIRNSQVVKAASGVQRARGDHPLPDVLEDLLGQCRLPQLAQQEPVQAGAVAGVELLEGGDLAADPGMHQRGVIRLPGWRDGRR